VALHKCERECCRARNQRPVFSVDGKKVCLSCFEKILATSSIDDHRIYRLSDKEEDFAECARAYTSHEIPA
jgi:hypothetical protein